MASSIYRNMKLKCRAVFFSVFMRSLCMKSASYNSFYEIKIRENQRENQKWIIQRHW